MWEGWSATGDIYCLIKMHGRTGWTGGGVCVLISAMAGSRRAISNGSKKGIARRSRTVGGDNVTPAGRRAMEEQRHKKKLAFLEHYRITGNITRAAELANCHRVTVYKWEEEDEKFAEAMASALEEAKDRLELEAYRRGVEGVNKPVIYKGEIMKEKNPTTGEMEPITIKEYSDHLLTVLLNASRPEKFKFRHEHTGPNNEDLFKSFVDAVVNRGDG